MPSTTPPPQRRVALVTLGCGRNEVDSEELAGRLAEQGWALDEPDAADVVVVNTCGFIDSAKKDSIETLLAAGDTGAKVVAVGCLAERYGEQLAGSLPEADAVLGFDQYAEIADRLDDVLAGRRVAPHRPRDRRTLLPITPVDRVAGGVAVPGHGRADHGEPDGGVGRDGVAGYRPPVLRRRLASSPVAPLKLASGCDRRCAFCAIPSFRGAFVSRPPRQLVEEARWLAGQGVRELVLVSENSTSYGKDLGDPRLLEALLPDLAAVEGIARVRVSYLQPAEMRPSLIEVIAGTPGVAPYFDLSFQHASAPLLRRMRRFGSRERFLDLLGRIRALAPQAGTRSNVIVGFPGETGQDLAELERFLTDAGLDAVGVFAYSDEEGTEGATLPGKVDDDTIAERYARLGELATELCDQRAARRVGERVEVLVESVRTDPRLGPVAEGHAAHQAPEVDGSTLLTGAAGVAVGDLVPAEVVTSEGVDLVARPYAGARP